MADVPPAELPDTTIVVESPELPANDPTTVIVEDTGDTTVVTDPADALAYADEIKRIAREEADNQILAWAALVEASAPEPEPVPVVAAPVVESAPVPVPEAKPPPEVAPKHDEPPPRKHWYYGSRGPGSKQRKAES